MGFYEFLIKPKTVRNSAFISVFALTFALVVGIIIAQWDPDGYNPFVNYISDLGSFNHTPFPYLWDAGQMLCAIFMVPAALYLREMFANYSKDEEKASESSKTRVILSYICMISMLIALSGMFMAGFFSEDRSGPLHMHLVASYIDFGGLALTGIVFGIAITFYPTPVYRPLGIYMMTLPVIPLVIFFTTFNKFIEWLLMFSIMIWIIPFALILLKHLNREIKAKG